MYMAVIADIYVLDFVECSSCARLVKGLRRPMSHSSGTKFSSRVLYTIKLPCSHVMVQKRFVRIGRSQADVGV